MLLAQISDPHLSSLDTVRWRDLASKRMLGYLSWRKRRRRIHRRDILADLVTDLKQHSPDHIAVTGDLTHIALPHEFRDAARWLETLGDPGDVTVIPGNHDAYVAVDWNDGPGQWQAYMQSDTARDEETGFPSLRRRGPVALIGLSSATPSAPLMATGTLGAAQLAQLDDLLAQCAREKLFRVVLIHHSPVPGHEKWRKRLTDTRQLGEVLARRGAEIILHGHGHRRVMEPLSVGRHRIPVFGAPSASLSSDKPERFAAYQLFDIEESTHGWRLQANARVRRPDNGIFETRPLIDTEIIFPD